MRTVLIIALLSVVFHHGWVSREIDPGPGMVAPYKPLQQPVAREPFPWGEFTVTPLAAFDVEARVLSTRRYRFDAEADLSPVDLALGWGPMSASEVLDHIDVRQSGRFYYWNTQRAPIPLREITKNSANMHLVPANDRVQSVLLDARKGHVIRFSGFLIKAERPDGWRWKSSLSRGDSGAGACELVFVERAELI